MKCLCLYGGSIRLQGIELSRVKEVKYLGATVQKDGECRSKAKKRVQAWKISARLKGRVYNTTVRPAMLCGMEAVAQTRRQKIS